MDTVDLLAKKALIDKKQTQLNKLYNKRITEIDALKKELLSCCNHPEEHLEQKHYYFSGSYYDLAYTEYWNKCTICGAESKRDRETHSYYG